MKTRTETRRDFLKHATLFSIPLLFGCDGFAQKSENDSLASIRKNAIVDAGCEWCGARDAPASVSWKTRLLSNEDNGERIVIGGTVYQPDGKTPAPNTMIYLYHTDVYGIYGRSGEHRHGRYRGWMLTDEKGRYEFESILPASYPNSTIAKHIHMTVTTADRREDWIDSILFEGDRFITERERIAGKGGFNPIVALGAARDGKRAATRDILL